MDPTKEELMSFKTLGDVMMYCKIPDQPKPGFVISAAQAFFDTMGCEENDGYSAVAGIPLNIYNGSLEKIVLTKAAVTTETA